MTVMATGFIKMHGIGNDFVVLDARKAASAISAEAARAIADRRRGIGYDQMLVLERPQSGGDVFMRILNPDGSVSGACGNGTRCIARLMMNESGRPSCIIETSAGLLRAEEAPGGLVSVDMGRPGLDWQQIPLAERMDTRRIDVKIGPMDAPYLHSPAAVNMGNPHAVFFVEDAAAIQLEKVGPLVENHPLFPERCNVSFAQVMAPDHAILRVWERSAGATLACGTAACATLVAGVRLGKLARKANLALPGGTLTIEWREKDDHVIMTGPAETSFSGQLGARLDALLTGAP